MCNGFKCPQCPSETVPVTPWRQDPPIENPNCICNMALLLHIPPGQHVHCPVHPNVKIYGGGAIY